jgi:phage terminase Nu1 subunit (DNA packaging protein)
MVMEETYLLTKHGRFSAEYIENIPVFKRRYFLNLMKEEADYVKKEREKSTTTVNTVKGIRR